MPSGEHCRPCASFHQPLWAQQTEDHIIFVPPVCSQPLLLPTSPSQDNQTTLCFLFFISIIEHWDIYWSLSDSLCELVWLWMNIKVHFIGVCILGVYLHCIYYTTHCLFLLPRSILCDLRLLFLSSQSPFSTQIALNSLSIQMHRQYTTNYPTTIDFIIYTAET